MKEVFVRYALLFALFWAIGLSLGYPTLNRYQPGPPHVADAVYYAEMVEKGVTETRDIGHWRYRVLVPALARPVYLAAQDRIGSWDTRFFALLVVNAAFCAGTALIVFALGRDLLGGSREGLLAAFLFYANFNTANLYLSGLVDSAEVFFLAAVLLAMHRGRWGLLPLLGIAGGMARESFVIYSSSLAGGWWLSEWRAGRFSIPRALYIAIMGGGGLGIVLLIRSFLSVGIASPSDLANAHVSATGLSQVVGHLASIPLTKAFWYTFGWLLPLGFFGIRRLPREFLWGAGAALIVALLISSYVLVGENIGRPLFSAGGAVLTLAATAGLVRLAESMRR